MRCHYEVLGIPQNASQQEIKTCYRKLALQWHPDKNPDKAEEAKAQFLLIQTAYEVLSDPHERSFYDRNRDSILRGKGSDAAEEFELNLFPYFSTSCFQDFDDGEKGFYTVYRRIFEEIAARDMEMSDGQHEEDLIIPSFGNSTTDSEDVAAFYAYWTDYCTRMSFVWEDMYNISQAPNRWAGKKIEKENRKSREKARKQFNEQVRELVAFAKKRDKRWKARKKKLDEEMARKRQKEEEELNFLREERSKQKKDIIAKGRRNFEEYNEQLRMLESQFASEWGIDDSEEEGSAEEQDDRDDLSEDLYCIACTKWLKTPQGLQDHYQTKKHLKMMEQLVQEMQEEDKLMNGGGEVEEDEANSSNCDPLCGEEEVLPSTFPESEGCGEEASAFPSYDSNTPDLTVQGQARNSSSEKKKSKLKKEEAKRKKKQDSVFMHSEVEDDEAKNGTVEEEDAHKEGSEEDLPKSRLKGKKAKEAWKKKKQDCAVLGSEEDKGEKGGFTEDAITCEEVPGEEEPLKSHLKGKKAKDAKKKKRAEELAAHKDNEVLCNRCLSCGKEYTSKNKLFQHLKVEGHAAFKEQKGSVKGNRKVR